MVRYYCDVCGKEMDFLKGDNAAFNRVHRKKGRVQAEVIVYVGGTANVGQVCRECVLDIVATGQDAKER